MPRTAQGTVTGHRPRSLCADAAQPATWVLGTGHEDPTGAGSTRLGGQSLRGIWRGDSQGILEWVGRPRRDERKLSTTRAHQNNSGCPPHRAHRPQMALPPEGTPRGKPIMAMGHGSQHVLPECQPRASAGGGQLRGTYLHLCPCWGLCAGPAVAWPMVPSSPQAKGIPLWESLGFLSLENPELPGMPWAPHVHVGSDLAADVAGLAVPLETPRKEDKLLPGCPCLWLAPWRVDPRPWRKRAWEGAASFFRSKGPPSSHIQDTAPPHRTCCFGVASSAKEPREGPRG